MSTENDEKTTLKTPADWCLTEGVEILDPDGWRGHNGRPWRDPITLDEFRARLVVCTQRSVALTTQPAGEHHTGTLNLTGEGYAPQDTLAALDGEIARTYGGIWAPDNLAEILAKHGWAKASETRQQVAEEIAAGAHEVAEQYQATAVTQRDIAIESGRNTPKGQSHMRTAHAFRNKADGAWAVAHMVHVIGGGE